MANSLFLYGGEKEEGKKKERRERLDKGNKKGKKERWEKIWTFFKLAYESHTQEQEEKIKVKKGPLQTSK
jgi:hypothetical protein